MAAFAHHPAPPPGPAVPSFDEVYRDHARFVGRTLRALGVPDAALEDALQEVFVVVHRRLGEFAGRAQIETWLFAIARRIASHQRRAAGRRDPLLALDAATDLPASADTFEELARAEAAALALRLLDQLDDDERAIFVLVDLEGVAVPAAALALDLKLNTAYSRLRRARQAFDAALARRSETP
jgi:RNA polymerase sigma-70 factor (ECF subfamily)